jgi:hypothetical protein
MQKWKNKFIYNIYSGNHVFDVTNDLHPNTKHTKNETLSKFDK